MKTNQAEPSLVYSPKSGKMVMTAEAKAEKARIRAARYREKLKIENPEAWDKAQLKIRAWHLANKERVANHKRKNFLKPATKEKRKAYQAKTQDLLKLYKKNYIKRNPEKRKATLERYNKTPKARMLSAIRARLQSALKAKTQSTCAYLGCSPDFFKKHMESQFVSGMTWENFWKWHMDHIVPLSAFDLFDPRQVQIACNWTNIRPIWAKENLRKSKKITHPQLSLPLIAQ